MAWGMDTGDQRLKETINEWRAAQGYEPIETPEVMDVPLKPPRTVAFRIGYVIGVGLVVAVLLGLLTLAGIGAWEVLR